MSRIIPGLVVKTSYNTGPYIISQVSDVCTCPKYVDSLNLGDKAPLSKPHRHYVCKDVNSGRRDPSYLGGYDENNNSVWNSDRIIVLHKETLLLLIGLL